MFGTIVASVLVLVVLAILSQTLLLIRARREIRLALQNRNDPTAQLMEILPKAVVTQSLARGVGYMYGPIGLTRRYPRSLEDDLQQAFLKIANVGQPLEELQLYLDWSSHDHPKGPLIPESPEVVEAAIRRPK